MWQSLGVGSLGYREFAFQHFSGLLIKTSGLQTRRAIFDDSMWSTRCVMMNIRSSEKAVIAVTFLSKYYNVTRKLQNKSGESK